MTELLKDLGVVALVACVVAVSAGIALAPEPADARPSAVVKRVIGGAEIQVVLEDPCPEPGERPTVTVTARNPGGTTVTCTAVVRLTKREVFPMRRVLPPPQEAWNRYLCLVLGPGESRTVVLTPEMELVQGLRFFAIATPVGGAPVEYVPLGAEPDALAARLYAVGGTEATSVGR